MKKLLACLAISTLAFTGSYTSYASEKSEVVAQSAQKLEQGTSTLENVTLGEPIQNVIQRNGNYRYSFSTDGQRHFYEFDKDNGWLIVTGDGEKDNGVVTSISMSYNHFNGPSYDEVKNSVSNQAVSNVNYNEVGGNWGYITDGNVSYQFGSESPNDKDIKLYRVIIKK